MLCSMTNTTRLRVAGLSAIPLTLLLLTGCGTSAGTTGAAAPGATSDPNASAAPTVTSTPSAASTEAKFGDTVTYKDGLAVTVTDKGKFKPGQYAAKEKAKSYRKFQVTVKNGTSEKFNPALVIPSLQDGEAAASSVTDVEGKIGIGPQTKLLPGKTVKWDVGFGVDTDDLVMDVPLNDAVHDDATFVSK